MFYQVMNYQENCNDNYHLLFQRFVIYFMLTDFMKTYWLVKNEVDFFHTTLHPCMYIYIYLVGRTKYLNVCVQLCYAERDG